MENEKIPCVVITRPDTHGKMFCVVQLAGFILQDEFDGAEDGESVTCTLKLMTKEELEALPDFAGW